MDDSYRKLKEHRPDLHRKVVEVGLCVTCSNGYRLVKDDLVKNELHKAAAAAENRTVELLLEALGIE